MKVAIVYDRVNKWGGAERVLLTLHEMFPEAPLYTSVYDEKNAPWAKAFPRVITSFIQKIPFAKNNHEFLAPLMPLAFETFNFDGFDLVISVTSESAKGIITRPGTTHICYCLTPTRYLWSGYEDYFKNSILKFITKPIVSYLKSWDKIASGRPDKIIAISTEVKSRIKRYYDRDSEIIFPPVNIHENIEPKTIEGKYYLIVSRLVSYKKVDLAIKTFNKLGYPLYIVGTGNQETKLKLMSRQNIKFLGGVSDEELLDVYKNAIALIMPQEEDFGIVSIEAQSMGIPVIAYSKGGAVDTVTDGITGVIFNEQNEESLSQAIEKFSEISFNRKTLMTNATRFSKEVFKKEFIKNI